MLHISTRRGIRLATIQSVPTMKRLKTGPMKSETNRKLVVLITANEKISNFRFRNSARTSSTMKTIVQALCRGVPVEIRIHR
jgi:hypothetical protein